MPKTAVLSPADIPCFEHDWTDWKSSDELVGEDWEIRTNEVWRECRECGHFQVRTVRDAR